MPQGGIDDSESEKQAMKRELMEETGLKKNYEIMERQINGFLMTFQRIIVKKWYRMENILDKCKNGLLANFMVTTMKLILRHLIKPEFFKWKWIEPKKV